MTNRTINLNNYRVTPGPLTGIDSIQSKKLLEMPRTAQNSQLPDAFTASGSLPAYPGRYPKCMSGRLVSNPISETRYFYTSNGLVMHKKPLNTTKLDLLVEACAVASKEEETRPKMALKPAKPPAKQTAKPTKQFNFESDPDYVAEAESSLLSPPLSPTLTAANPPVALPSKPEARPSKRPVYVPSFKKVTKVAKRALVKPQREATRPSYDSKTTHVPCVSCGICKSPCWRPSWSIELGQLCNSCGLRYRKTRVRCPQESCSHIPSKIELASLKSKGTFSCSVCSKKLCQD